MHLNDIELVLGSYPGKHGNAQHLLEPALGLHSIDFPASGHFTVFKICANSRTFGYMECRSALIPSDHDHPNTCFPT